jgi:hypothetical protein
VFHAPAIVAEHINFDRAVRMQHTEQILHCIGHGSSPLRAIAESPSRFGGSGLAIRQAWTVVALPYRSCRLRQNRVTVVEDISRKLDRLGLF